MNGLLPAGITSGFAGRLQAGGGQANRRERVDGGLHGGSGDQKQAKGELVPDAVALHDAPGPEYGFGGKGREPIHLPPQRAVEAALGRKRERDGLLEQQCRRQDQADGAVTAGADGRAKGGQTGGVEREAAERDQALAAAADGLDGRGGMARPGLAEHEHDGVGGVFRHAAAGRGRTPGGRKQRGQLPQPPGEEQTEHRAQGGDRFAGRRQCLHATVTNF